ncbi:uncharacterized protein LY89DRAFT_510913 [Mollisia scopiformis]|uniref:Uncharacterized protein n=1 Tax=Mollisia scopiformis TaxID=149040 RepID=A0A194XFQ1_MOLSC|nr:uncharacterized protein LY89DRAFT_510913 [Mollisia scopiformis]KUJ19025.1 hypothetical protein LY89DRAFT_510913 [Mollisia scopiformis]
MSGPLPAGEPFLASYLRVLRGIDSLPDLVELFPTLEQKVLAAPSTLSEHERRQLLDLADAQDEVANLQQVSSRARAELLSSVLSSPEILTDDEIELVKNRFWSPPTLNEVQQIFNGSLNRIQDFVDRIFAVREAVYLPNESRAFTLASIEFTRREKQRRDEKQSKLGGPNPPAIPAWMNSLSQRFSEEKMLKTWGYIALLDSEAQTMSADRRDLFMSKTQAIFTQTMLNNGARSKLLNKTWKISFINAPSTVSASLEPNADNSELRDAFRTLLDPNKEYNAPQGPDPRSPHDILQKRKGYLSNTFLVINKTCIDSVLASPGYSDDMRILAFEADFPQPGRTYVEGYQGWTWVRLEQLVDAFYGARMDEELGMDEIWKAAERSKNEVFASLDAEEAGIWTTSTSMTGPLPGSILGKRRRRAP